MNADGSGLHRLTHGVGVTSPTWAPDGHRLAFVRDQGTALCTIGTDGSHLRAIATARHYYQHPRWSPLGNLIVYQSAAGNIDHAVTFTIRPDGTRERRLPLFLGGGSYPSWSPDGRKLAFAHGDHLAILDLASGRTQQLPGCPRGTCYGDAFPAWSPDGRKIAFLRENRRAVFHLFVLDLSSHLAAAVGSPETKAFEPSWRP
jgi:TolB protein